MLTNPLIYVMLSMGMLYYLSLGLYRFSNVPVSILTMTVKLFTFDAVLT